MKESWKQMWTLYQEGHKKAEIAIRLKVHAGTVQRVIKTLQERSCNGEDIFAEEPAPAWKVLGQCRYSPDCFSCPLPDCWLPSAQAVTANRLPGDLSSTKQDELLRSAPNN